VAVDLLVFRKIAGGSAGFAVPSSCARDGRAQGARPRWRARGESTDRSRSASADSTRGVACPAGHAVALASSAHCSTLGPSHPDSRVGHLRRRRSAPSFGWRGRNRGGVERRIEVRRARSHHRSERMEHPEDGGRRADADTIERVLDRASSLPGRRMWPRHGWTTCSAARSTCCSSSTPQPEEWHAPGSQPTPPPLHHP